MDFMKLMERNIKKLGIWDWALVKIGSMLFGLIIGAYISAFVRQYVILFIVVFVILYVLSAYKFFK